MRPSFSTRPLFASPSRLVARPRELSLINRRQALGLSASAALGALLGCGSSAGGKPSSKNPDGAAFPDSGALPDGGSLRPDAADLCRITDENILGPFYKADAPYRADIRGGAQGELLRVTGTVFARDCETPLADALVDVWQADAEGGYDTEGFTLRGRIRTSADGTYDLTTLVPGRYLNGPTYRPSHIHYRVSHPDGVPLTTQLYFEGDPFLESDPFVEESLIMPIVTEEEDGGLVRRVRFDVVLA